MKRRGPAWVGSAGNLLSMIFLLVACVTNYWVSGQYGYVGLWRQCFYGLPCTDPDEPAAHVSRVFLVVSLLTGSLALGMGLGMLNAIREDLPAHVLACFTVVIAGFIGIVATAVFIAGYYLDMGLSWSWVLSLLGSVMQMFVVAPLYWYSHYLQAQLLRIVRGPDPSSDQQQIRPDIRPNPFAA